MISIYNGKIDFDFESISSSSTNLHSSILTIEKNMKKLCFNYLRGRCHLNEKDCIFRHPTSPVEAEIELRKLAIIECKYGKDCVVGECLYKHENRLPFLFTLINKNKKIKEVEITKKNFSSSSSNFKDSKELREQLENENIQASHLLVTLRQVFDCEISDEFEIPQVVINLIISRPDNILSYLSNPLNPIELFSLTNTKSDSGDYLMIFDLYHQQPKSYPILVDHMLKILNVRNKNEAWIIVSSYGGFIEEFENNLYYRYINFTIGNYLYKESVNKVFHIKLKQ